MALTLDNVQLAAQLYAFRRPEGDARLASRAFEPIDAQPQTSADPPRRVIQPAPPRPTDASETPRRASAQTGAGREPPPRPQTEPAPTEPGRAGFRPPAPGSFLDIRV
ncbi:MAG: hypothetical protein ACFB2Z_04925 [Maricaulaceae bacterium]